MAEDDSDEAADDTEEAEDASEEAEGDSEEAEETLNGKGDNSGSEEEEDWMNEAEHMKSLKKLQKTDPDFYKYLEENDKKLLQFQESDGEDDDDDNKGGVTHELPDKLEEDSEESDFEADDDLEKKSSAAVTFAQLEEWRTELVSNPSPKSITRTADLFHAALDRLTGDEGSVYKIEGSAVFNAVIEMCVMHMQSALVDFLKLTPSNVKNPEKSKRWVKVRGALNMYFTDLFKLMEGVASDHILSVMLKHLHSMCSFVSCFPKISKSALKTLTKLWSTGEETVRVLAFLCILRLTTHQKGTLLNAALKLMYIAYIRGSKFVSVNTLPQINFMKQTLVDLYKLDPALSYQHAFLYIRQLAIHLRNAVTIHKKESFQTVYNWQYIHSLRLWVNLLCEAPESADLQQLLYPVVQIALGCVKLIPSAQYVPLRFHCIQMLIKLGRETNTFIPTLPLIVDSLAIVDLNKHHKKASMKPFDFTFVLRVSKTAMAENGFTDAVVEYVFQLLMESAAAQSHSIAFPDLIVPAIIQLKGFIKTCTVPKYNSKLKQILAKLNENYNFVNTARSQLSLALNETAKITAFEADLKAKGTPLAKYSAELKKSQNLRQAKQATNNDKIANERMNLPKIIKRPAKKQSVPEGPVDLFPSDESDFEFPDVDDGSQPKPKKSKKVGKKAPKTEKKRRPAPTEFPEDDTPDQDDVVEELDIKSF